MWPSGYRRCIFNGDISGSDLDFFFCKFRPSYFQVSFLFSSFILLIFNVKFNNFLIENCTSFRVFYNKDNCVSSSIFGLVGNGQLGCHFSTFLLKLRSEFTRILKPVMKFLNIKLTKYLDSHIQIKLYLSYSEERFIFIVKLKFS